MGKDSSGQIQAEAAPSTAYMEKEDWLAKIRRDNEALIEVVNSVKTKKKQFITSVREVEKERLAMRALQVDFADSKVAKEISGGLLSPQNRLLLPMVQRNDAEQLHLELEMIATKIRANQLDVLQLTLSKVKAAEEAFLDRRPDDLEGVLDELRSLAAATPCNLLTAKNMVNDLPATILKAIKEEELRLEQAMVRGEAVEITEPRDERALRRQNQMLKSSLDQLRRKNAQLRNKLLRMRKSMEDAQPKTHSMDGSKGMRSSGGGFSFDHDLQVLTAAPTGESWNALDEDMKKVCMDLVQAHVTKCVRGHPMAEGAQAWMESLAISESTLALRNYVAAFVEEQLAVAKDVTSFTWLPSTVTAYFRTASGHAEVMSKVMLVLTYLNQMCHHLGLEIDSGQNSDKAAMNGNAAGGSGKGKTDKPRPSSRIATPGEGEGEVADSLLYGRNVDDEDFTLNPAAKRPKEKTVPRYMSNYKGRVSAGRGRLSMMSPGSAGQ